MQLVDVLPLRILRIEEASSVNMESNKKKKKKKKLSTPIRIYICFAKQRFCIFCGHLRQNMLSNLFSLLRDMFPTCLISTTSPRIVESDRSFFSYSFLLF